MDKLILRELHFLARHGILPIERETSQRFSATLELERAGSATCVRMNGQMEPRGPMKLLAPLMRKPIERQYERVAESFRHVVEADARS